MLKIYLIFWSGRNDCGFWDEYPCLEFGYFMDFNEAEKITKKLNKKEKIYDEEAGEFQEYYVQQVEKNRGL